jgi:hypothetical protein
MKKSWMLFFFMPTLIFAAYPIYEDDVASQQPELLARKSHPSKDVVKDEHGEKASVDKNREENPLKESKQRLRDRPYFRDRKAVKLPEKQAPSTEEKKQSAISKRDPVKRNSAIQSSHSRSKLRQHPNRPRVIQRDGKKQSQNLSKIEADAEEIENGLSTHQNEEWENQEKSSLEAATAQENEELDGHSKDQRRTQSGYLPND